MKISDRPFVLGLFVYMRRRGARMSLERELIARPLMVESQGGARPALQTKGKGWTWIGDVDTYIPCNKVSGGP